MNLSDEQMGAAMHGLGGKKTWEPRELPAGIWTPPPWLKGAYVDMHEAYSNPPSVKLKTFGSPWPEDEPVLYENEGDGQWIARSADGYVMQRHHHDGPLRQVTAWRIRSTDEVVTKSNPDGWNIAYPKPGQTQHDATVEAAEKHLVFCRRQYVKDGILERADEYTLEYREMWATTKQNGFGGRHFHIRLKDGRDVVLIGPWHGGSPVGWQDCTVFDVERWDATMRPYRGTKMLPWYRRGGSFGFFFSNELVLRAVARWQPHVAVAMVYPGYGHARYEFYDPAWGAPKAFAAERRRGWGPGA